MTVASTALLAVALGATGVEVAAAAGGDGRPSRADAASERGPSPDRGGGKRATPPAEPRQRSEEKAHGRPTTTTTSTTSTTSTTTTTTTVVASPVAAAAVAEPQVVAAAVADVQLTFTTWHVIGLDSNDVTAGPNVYPTGVRACNGGPVALSGVSATWTWDTANAFLDLEGPAVQAVGDLSPGECAELFWNVVVDRDPAAYDATRRFHVTVSDGTGSVSTPVRELYVERLNSQNRNSVLSLTGPTEVVVGQTVTYVVDAKTAPGGYEQVEAFLAFPSSVFRLVSMSVTYGTPAGATADEMYADACGWDPDFASATYMTCIGPANYAGGKAGDSIQTVYTFEVVGTGTGNLSSAIYDKSGSSYHYNTDFGQGGNLLVVTAVAPPPVGPAAAPPPAPTAPVPGVPPAAVPTAPAPTVPAAPAARASGPLPRTGAGSTVPLVQLAIGLLVVGTAVRRSSRPTAASSTVLAT